MAKVISLSERKASDDGFAAFMEPVNWKLSRRGNPYWLDRSHCVVLRRTSAGWEWMVTRRDDSNVCDLAGLRAFPTENDAKLDAWRWRGRWPLSGDVEPVGVVDVERCKTITAAVRAAWPAFDGLSGHEKVLAASQLGSWASHDERKDRMALASAAQDEGGSRP
jgi:hypothetical protein